MVFMIVAVTRPRLKSEDTEDLIRKYGYEPFIVPAVEIVPNFDVIDKINLENYDWIVLTSSFGAELLADKIKKNKKIRVACIGEKTKESLKKHGINVNLVPKKYRAEELAEELKKVANGKKILVARANIAREVLIKELKKVADVDEVKIYDIAEPRDTKDVEEFYEELKKGRVYAIIFTSSQNVINLKKILKDRFHEINKIKVCAIGPITAKTLEKHGIRVDFVPEVYTVEACLKALINN